MATVPESGALFFCYQGHFTFLLYLADGYFKNHSPLCIPEKTKRVLNNIELNCFSLKSERRCMQADQSHHGNFSKSSEAWVDCIFLLNPPNAQLPFSRLTHNLADKFQLSDPHGEGREERKLIPSLLRSVSKTLPPCISHQPHRCAGEAGK